jgi:hypothetical protein
MDPIEQVRAFAEAADLEGKWSSARQMMSSKAKPNGELFYSLLQQGFEGLGHIAEKGDDFDRLVAIDLLAYHHGANKPPKLVTATWQEGWPAPCRNGSPWDLRWKAAAGFHFGCVGKSDGIRELDQRAMNVGKVRSSD